jgi:hypothetical protein
MERPLWPPIRVVCAMPKTVTRSCSVIRRITKLVAVGLAERLNFVSLYLADLKFPNGGANGLNMAADELAHGADCDEGVVQQNRVPIGLHAEDLDFAQPEGLIAPARVGSG